MPKNFRVRYRHRPERSQRRSSCSELWLIAEERMQKPAELVRILQEQAQHRIEQAGNFHSWSSAARDDDLLRVVVDQSSLAKLGWPTLIVHASWGSCPFPFDFGFAFGLGPRSGLRRLRASCPDPVSSAHSLRRPSGGSTSLPTTSDREAGKKGSRHRPHLADCEWPAKLRVDPAPEPVPPPGSRSRDAT